MRRLVYAPKVWIFIRSSNLPNNTIFDVSDDIVRGSVTQKLNDVSTARFELRNRYQKWVRDRHNGFRSIFLPMDLCTIWMQRIAGKPIQVFTGYLDSVPYYQAYPGNAIFEATCTLKKLAYNWFDPGLMTFMNWFADNSEWEWDPSSGGAVVKGASGILTEEAKARAGPDSGIGKLLGQFMVDIAGWAPEDVIIDKLDPRLADRAAKLYLQLESGLATNVEEAARLFKEFMSVNGATGHSHRPTELKLKDWRDAARGSYFSEDAEGNPVASNAAIEVVQAIQAVATQANLSPAMMIFNAIVMTNLDPNYEQGIGSSSNWGFGLYAMRPNTGSAANPGSVVPAKDDDMADLAIDKTPLIDVYLPTTATNLLAARLNSARAQGPWVNMAKQGDVESMLKWLAHAVGRGAPTNVDFTRAWEDAQKLAATEMSMDPAKQVTPSPTIGSNMTFEEPAIRGRLTTMELGIVEQFYANSNQALIIPTLLMAKSLSTKLRLGALDGLRANEIFIVGPPNELESFYNQIAGDARYESVVMRVGGKETKTHAYGLPTRVAGGGLERVGGGVSSEAEGIIAAVAAVGEIIEAASHLGTHTKDELINTPRGERFINKQVRASLGEGGASFKQLGAFSANAAFAANFAFPTDVISATLLTGSKAWMNDTSCLDAVRQFCQASMRAFRSLPDGRFLAFYPDYFSAKRSPYWKIENIEIIDFGIQLNDEALATHVYVIGDHFQGASDVPAILNAVASRGVATITHAGIVDSMINWGDQGSGPAHRLFTGLAFLKHYGARPHKYDVSGGGGGAPLIRNSMYEFLLAWQQFMLLWAQQFATSCQFTFMPEVMAGGVIEFAQHGIQMFCDSVTHNFDYQSGFTTDAQMTAPALSTNAKQKDLRNFPGMALAGGTNTVGVGLG